MTWERKGECNHCGACCLFLTFKPAQFLINIEKDSERDDTRFHEVRGLSPAGDGPDQTTFRTADAWLWGPCREFDQRAYRCRIHPDKPQTCHEFPNAPGQVENSPCSYYFERTREDNGIERIGGLGSPYPGTSIEVSGMLQGSARVAGSPPFRGAGPVEEEPGCEPGLTLTK